MDNLKRNTRNAVDQGRILFATARLHRALLAIDFLKGLGRLPSELTKLLPLLLAVPMMAASLRVYVANTDGATISIIDPSTNQVIGEIPVSKNPHAVLLSPDKSRFYVPSESQDVLDVMDRPSLKSIARVPLGRRPNNLAITSDGRYVYVCIRQES